MTATDTPTTEGFVLAPEGPSIDGPSGPGSLAPSASGLVRAVVDTLLAALLAACAGLAWTAAFRADDIVGPVLAGAAGGAAVSFLATHVLRQTPTVSSLMAVPLLGGLALVACGAVPAELVTGWIDGTHTILSVGVPVRADSEVLVVVFGVTAWSAFVAAEVAHRSPSAAMPVLPSLVGFVVALLFGIDGREVAVGIPVVWVAVVLATVGWRSSRGARRATVVTTSQVTRLGATGRGARPRTVTETSAAARTSRGRMLIMVALAAVVAFAARGLSQVLPGSDEDDRFALREHVDPGFQAPEFGDPLGETTALQDGEDVTMFVADTSAPVERWRMAVLDSYDGENWRPTGEFVRAGAELAGAADGGTRVTQSIQTGELDGPWLPVADRVLEVSAADVGFDEAAGVLLADSTELPDSYTAVSVVPRLDAERLTQARAASDTEARAALQLPAEVPRDLVTLANDIAGTGGGSAYSKAVALEQYLKAGDFTRVVEEIPSGHAFGHLRCFLFAEDSCAQRGSTEQFVAAFAVLARAAELPTRVVVGFDGSGAAGRDDVTAHEATAWAEVKFAGIGWVAFDPSPDPTVETTPPTTALPGSQETPPDSGPTTTAGRSDEDDDRDDDTTTAASDDSGNAWLVALVVGPAVLLVALLLPGLLRMRRRISRRAARDPRIRLAGAWAATVEDLRRGGVRLGRGSAVTDIVAAGLRHYGPAASSLQPLGLVVNRASFDIYPPTQSEADQAWQLSQTFVQSRRKSRPLARRLREYFAL